MWKKINIFGIMLQVFSYACFICTGIAVFLWVYAETSYYGGAEGWEWILAVSSAVSGFINLGLSWLIKGFSFIVKKYEPEKTTKFQEEKNL